MIRSRGEKIFTVINYGFLILLGLLCVLPFIHVLAISLSEAGYVIGGQVSFWPKGFTFFAYEKVLQDPAFYRAFMTSVIVTVSGTIISVVVLTLAAYPLSKPDLPFRGPLMIFFIIVMLFSGGIVPNYLLMQGIGLTNTIFALIFPSVIQVFNLILIKNYFEGLPKEIEESAKIDGATNYQLLIKIIVPISLPLIATVCLFTAVIYWNNYFNALLYVSDQSKWPLQMYILNMLQETNTEDVLKDPILVLYQQGIESATIILSTLPIIITYPFLQKFFVKGIVVGSVKG